MRAIMKKPKLVFASIYSFIGNVCTLVGCFKIMTESMRFNNWCFPIVCIGQSAKDGVKQR